MELGQFNLTPIPFSHRNKSSPNVSLRQIPTINCDLSSIVFAFGFVDGCSRHILQRRWLDEEKATLQELADHDKVSAEHIRQLENNAIKKLRTVMT